MHRLLRMGIWRIAALTALNRSRVQGLRLPAPTAPFISSTRDDLSPQFSQDGKRIVFVSARSGHPEIWVCNSDGSSAAQLTSFGGPFVTTPRWSPDGEKIVFDGDVAGEYDIWTIGATGGKPRRMTTHPANDGNPSWSRDGRWIYFDSARAGAQQVFKMPADGGDAIQITHDGGFAPLESPDGKFLYYTKDLNNTSLWKVPVEGGQAVRILDDVSTYINLAITQEGVYFVPVHRAATASSIQFLDFATNAIRTALTIEKRLDLDVFGGLTVSPDGRTILYTQIEQAGSELMLVENVR